MNSETVKQILIVHDKLLLNCIEYTTIHKTGECKFIAVKDAEQMKVLIKGATINLDVNKRMYAELIIKY